MNPDDQWLDLWAEDGQGLVEYGLIIALIAIIIISVMMALGPRFTEFIGEDLDQEAVEEPTQELENKLDEEGSMEESSEEATE